MSRVARRHHQRRVGQRVVGTIFGGCLFSRRFVVRCHHHYVLHVGLIAGGVVYRMQIVRVATRPRLCSRCRRTRQIVPPHILDTRYVNHKKTFISLFFLIVYLLFSLITRVVKQVENFNLNFGLNKLKKV